MVELSKRCIAIGPPVSTFRRNTCYRSKRRQRYHWSSLHPRTLADGHVGDGDGRHHMGQDWEKIVEFLGANLLTQASPAHRKSRVPGIAPLRGDVIPIPASSDAFQSRLCPGQMATQIDLGFIYSFCSFFFSCSSQHHQLPSRSSLGLGGEAQVRLDGAHLGEQLGGLLALDSGVDNDVVTRHPVDRGGDLVLVASLQRVDDAQDLGAVAASRRGVREDGADGLLGVDEEDGADREGNALLVDVGGVLVVDPGPKCQQSQPVNVCASWHKLTCRRGRQPCAPCRR